MPSPNSLAEEIQQDFCFHTMEAERLLMDICREGRTELLTSEKAYLAREMGWDEQAIRKEMRRVNSILRLTAISGTSENRESALTECQTATDLLAKEGPKIQQKIADLQSKLNSLERDATSAQRRVEQQSDAVQQLRGFCPAHIKEQVQQARKVVEAGIGQDLRDSKTRLNELRSILNLDNCHGDQKKHLEWGLQRSLPAAVEKILHGNPKLGSQTIELRYSAQWPALKAECEKEYAELSGRLPEIQAEYDEQIRQSELPLDFYSNGPREED